MPVWALPPSVNLESRHMTYTALVRRKTQQQKILNKAFNEQ
jgi:hypothetical protein